jgi:hypothetical protein
VNETTTHYRTTLQFKLLHPFNIKLNGSDYRSTDYHSLSTCTFSRAQKSSLPFGYAWRSKCWHLTYDWTVISWLTVAPTAAKLKMQTDVVTPIYWPAFCLNPYHSYRLFQFTSFTFLLSSVVPCKVGSYHHYMARLIIADRADACRYVW